MSRGLQVIPISQVYRVTLFAIQSNLGLDYFDSCYLHRNLYTFFRCLSAQRKFFITSKWVVVLPLGYVIYPTILSDQASFAFNLVVMSFFFFLIWIRWKQLYTSYGWQFWHWVTNGDRLFCRCDVYRRHVFPFYSFSCERAFVRHRKRIFIFWSTNENFCTSFFILKQHFNFHLFFFLTTAVIHG